MIRSAAFAPIMVIEAFGLAEGDPDRVAAATEQHLRGGFRAILGQLTGRARPDPFDVDAD